MMGSTPSQQRAALMTLSLHSGAAGQCSLLHPLLLHLLLQLLLLHAKQGFKSVTSGTEEQGFFLMKAFQSQALHECHECYLHECHECYECQKLRNCKKVVACHTGSYSSS